MLKEVRLAQGFPQVPLVRTGYACQNRCRFCDQSERREQRRDTEAALVEAALDAAIASHPRALVLAGGEVTLRQELPAWIRRASDAGIERVILQTHGRALADPRYVAGLLAAGRVGFAVALHGHVATLHDWLTGVAGSFDETLRGLGNVRAAGAPLYLNTVVVRPNFRHLAEVVALGGRHGALQARLHWLRAKGDATRHLAALAPHPELVRPYLERAQAIAQRIGVRLSLDTGEPASSLAQGCG